MFILIVGFIATILSTFSLLPQVIKVYRAGTAKDISLASQICFFSAAVFWIIYGLSIVGLAIVITNIFMCLFSFILIVLKFKESVKKDYKIKRA